MLTKMKNIRKKSKKKISSNHMAQGKPQLKFKSNPCINSEIIDATDGRRTMDGPDGRRTNFDFMRSADIVKQS